jgi:hypothetical protein
MTMNKAKIAVKQTRDSLARLEKSCSGEITAAEAVYRATCHQAKLRLDAERGKIKEHYRPMREALQKQLKAAQRDAAHLEGPVK